MFGAGIWFTPNGSGEAALVARLARAEAQIGELTVRATAAQTVTSTPASASDALTDLAEMRRRLAETDSRLAVLSANPPATTGPAANLSADLAALAATLAETRQQAALAADAARAAQVAADMQAGRIAAIERITGAVGAAQAAGPASARLVLTDRIASALADGRAFTGEVAALQALSAPADLLAIIAPMAGGGVPTTAALLAQMRPLRPAMLEETAAVPQGLGDRLLRMTDGLVRVRAAGTQEGNTPVAIVSRIDAGLQRGNHIAAASAWASLPEPARRASAAFGASLQTRAAVDQAIARMADEAVAALGLK